MTNILTFSPKMANILTVSRKAITLLRPSCSSWVIKELLRQCSMPEMIDNMNGKCEFNL